MNVLSTSVEPVAIEPVAIEPVAIDCVIIDWDQVQLPATGPEPHAANDPARL